MSGPAIPSHMTARQYREFLATGAVPSPRAQKRAEDSTLAAIKQAHASPDCSFAFPLKAKGRLPAAGRSYGTEGMNKLEAAYAATLEAERHSGRVLSWKYEPFGLRLARKTFYHPDFLVVLADGATEIHETKGHMQDDAAVKLKTAARLFPFWCFRLVKRQAGAWAITEVLR